MFNMICTFFSYMRNIRRIKMVCIYMYVCITTIFTCISVAQTYIPPGMKNLPIIWPTQLTYLMLFFFSFLPKWYCLLWYGLLIIPIVFICFFHSLIVFCLLKVTISNFYQMKQIKTKNVIIIKSNTDILHEHFIFAFIITQYFWNLLNGMWFGSKSQICKKI